MVFVELTLADNPVMNLWHTASGWVEPYPLGVQGVPHPIKGTAFFPGGLGLLVDEDETRGVFPEDSIMVVGQDFNSVLAYERARSKGTEVGLSTAWRILSDVFSAGSIPLRQCFFTNVYMGLRTHGPETGRFPGARDRAFVGRCVEFFNRQLEAVKPRLIMTLGIEPLRVLARAGVFSIPVPKTLSECEGLYLDVPLIHGRATVVALTHPSFRHLNVGRRKYGDFIGSDAEKALIAAAREAAFPEMSL
jgi:hypothetical protein